MLDEQYYKQPSKTTHSPVFGLIQRGATKTMAKWESTPLTSQLISYPSPLNRLPLPLKHNRQTPQNPERQNCNQKTKQEEKEQHERAETNIRKFTPTQLLLYVRKNANSSKIVFS